MTRRSEKAGFPGGLGPRLVGDLELPEGDPRAAALFAPCFTCTKDAKAIVRIARALTDAGLAVLRYDVTGIGGSSGDFAATTFANSTTTRRIFAFEAVAEQVEHFVADFFELEAQVHENLSGNAFLLAQ